MKLKQDYILWKHIVRQVTYLMYAENTRYQKRLWWDGINGTTGRKNRWLQRVIALINRTRTPTQRRKSIGLRIISEEIPIHPFDEFCALRNIEHKLIRPRTPWHNGKVERSHRNDQERFYNYLSSYSFSDLQTQMKRYLRRSNNIYMAVLGCKSPNRKQMEPELNRSWTRRLCSLHSGLRPSFRLQSL